MASPVTIDPNRPPVRVAIPIYMIPWSDSPSHGIGRYIFEIARGLDEYGPELGISAEIYQDAYAPRGPFASLPGHTFPSIREHLGVSQVTVEESAKEHFARGFSRSSEALPSLLDHVVMYGRDVLRRRVLTRTSPDLIHYPIQLGRPPAPRGIPLVVTVHDLVPSLFPETARADVLQGWRHFVRHIGRITIFITPSQSAAGDLAKTLEVPEDLIRVIPNGVAPMYRPSPTPEKDLSYLVKRYGIRSPFIVHVGTIEPRKDLPTAIRALKYLPENISLALAGGPGWKSDNLDKVIAEVGVEGRVQRIGFVDDADLPSLYSAAKAAVFPSLYEGFGFPALEAMACGVPVVSTPAGSLEEVLGDTGIYFEARSPEELAKGIRRILEDPEWAADLALRARRRASEFSWRRAVFQTAHVYHEALASHARAGGRG